MKYMKEIIYTHIFLCLSKSNMKWSVSIYAKLNKQIFKHMENIKPILQKEVHGRIRNLIYAYHAAD